MGIGERPLDTVQAPFFVSAHEIVKIEVKRVAVASLKVWGASKMEGGEQSVRVAGRRWLMSRRR